MSRAQIAKEIDAYEEGGSVGDRYLQMMQQQQQTPATMEDYQAEAERLSFLAPQSQRPSFFDLATSLSQGLTAQAQSGQPASIGYGLAAGFNRFSEQQQGLRKQSEAIKQQIMMKAYEGVEQKRKEQKAINAKAAEYTFKAELELMKSTGELFKGTSIEAGSWNYILGKIDPATNDYKMVPDGKGGMKKYDPNNDAHYTIAKAVLEAPKTETRNVPGQGQVSIQTPGFNVNGALNLNNGVPQGAIDYLKTNDTPANRAAFVSKYGSLPGGM